MADLKISALNALSGADLVAADVVAVVDDSASETKKLTVSDLIANGVTLISDNTIPSAKILFAAGAIDTAELAASAVETAKINDSAVTAAKLADNSSVTLVSTLPASGDFTGQIALDTDDDKIYVWDGSAWDSVKGAGSINVVNGSTSGIVNITTSTSGDTVTISTTLDDTSAAKQFLAGPTGAGGTVGYRAIASGDLPTATTSAKGAVAVNGNGLTMNNDEIQIDNSVTAETTEHHLVQYDANGLITAGRVIASSDLPEATSSAKGAVVPGSGLDAAAGGTLNHSNSTTPGTFTKVTVDAQGHVTSAVTLVASDIPELDADKITTGTFPTARLADDAVTAAKLADQSVAKFGGAGATDNVVTFPDGDFKGQFFFDEKNEDLYIYTGESFLPITVISGNLVNAGTYNANTNLLTSVTTAGSAAGFTNGAALPNPAAGNLNYYVVVDTSGTGSGNAPAVALAPPDMLISLGVAGTTFQLIDVSNAIAGQTAANISVVATGNIAATDVQAALQELDTEKLAKAGGTMTGNLELGAGIVIVFEGATANDYETTLTVTDPTADRTITLPNETGTVVTTGSSGVVTSTMITDGTIVNADISASAEIAVSKLANGSARQLLQTDAAGTGVEFTSNVDVPGTLDVTGAATLDSTLAVTGATTVTGVINADGKVKFPAGSAASPSFYNGTDTDTGLYFSAANEISVATGGTQRVVVDSSGDVGIGLASPSYLLDVYSQSNDIAQFSGINGGSLLVRNPSTNVINLNAQTGDSLTFGTNGNNERARIDTVGRLLLGTSSARATGGSQNRYLQVEGTTYASAGLSLTCNSTSQAPTFNFGRSRGTSVGSSTAVQDGDDLGYFNWSAADGTDLTSYAAGIHAQIDGTAGSNNTPGRLIFSTTAPGNAAASERVRIDSSGRVGIGSTSPTDHGSYGGTLEISGNPGGALYLKSSSDVGQLGMNSSGLQLRTRSAKDILFSTNNSERVRIDSSGNLGVAISSPSGKLHVNGTGIFESAITAKTYIQGHSSALTFYGDSSAGSSDAMVLKSDGKLALGVSSPAHNLDVYLSGRLNQLGQGGHGLLVGPGSNTGGFTYMSTGDIEISTAQTTKDIVFSDAVGGNERMRLTGDTGRLGIGTASPIRLLSVSNGGAEGFEFGPGDSAGTNLTLHYNRSTSAYIGAINQANYHTWSAGGASEKMRLDTSGRLLVGTSSSINFIGGTSAGLQAINTSTQYALGMERATNDTAGPVCVFRKTRSTTNGGNTVVNSGDALGHIRFAGTDGSSAVSSAEIKAEVDGTPGSNDMPGRLVFSTTADGASSPTEHFRIANNGDLTATDTTIGSNSDSRLKTNIADFAYDLEAFKQYQPKTFDWKNPELHGNKTGQRGFIAQDVEAVDSYWVGEQIVDEGSQDAQFLDENRVAKTLKLGKKDAMYVSVIQQLLAKVETLEAKVAALEAE